MTDSQVPLSFKQRRLQEKSEKHRLYAQKIIASEGGPERVFGGMNCKPSVQQFADICVASKYGPQDPLFAGGENFALEVVIREVNNSVADHDWNGEERSNRDVVDHNGISLYLPSNVSASDVVGQLTDSDKFYLYSSITPHFWANIMVVIVINQSLVPYLQPFKFNDFKFDQNLGIYKDVESSLIGMRIYTQTMLPFADYPLRPDTGHGAAPHPLKSNDHFTQYLVQVGLVEDFDQLEDAEKHGVKMHERHLASGKIVPVKGHERRNPTYRMSRKSNLDEVSHVVYQAYDKEGALRYIGEGKENRPHHVNSGASHNFKLNEHFFLRGPMEVKIVATGLSKSESLAIEYLLIKKHTSADLWNIKDNEPFANENEQ